VLYCTRFYHLKSKFRVLPIALKIAISGFTRPGLDTAFNVKILDLNKALKVKKILKNNMFLGFNDSFIQ